MKSGYKIEWTDYALEELAKTIEYLEKNFTERELKNLSVEIEAVIKLISQNPKTFQKTDVEDVRKVVVKKFNTLFYRQKGSDTVEILSFFSNRKNPDKRKY